MRANGRRGAGGLTQEALSTVAPEVADFERVPTVRAAVLTRPVELETSAGLMAGAAGDFVVELPDGSLEVWSAERFVAHFQPKRVRKKAA